MALFLFVVAALFLVAGLLTYISAVEISSFAQSAMHQIYAAETTGNAILLFGFGFAILGIASIAGKMADKADEKDNRGEVVAGRGYENNSTRRDNAASNGKTDVKTFHGAVASGSIDAVNSLIRDGADVNARDRFGWFPLNWALRCGHYDITKALIKAGANVDAKTNEGKTPLHIAAKEGMTEMVGILVNNGAVLRMRDNDGRTALEVAMAHKNNQSAQLLRDAMAKQKEKTTAEAE